MRGFLFLFSQANGIKKNRIEITFPEGWASKCNTTSDAVFIDALIEGIVQNNSPRRLSCSVCAVKLKLVFKGTLPVSIKGAQKKATLGRSSCPVSPDSGTIFFSNAVARIQGSFGAFIPPIFIVIFH